MKQLAVILFLCLAVSAGFVPHVKTQMAAAAPTPALSAPIAAATPAILTAPWTQKNHTPPPSAQAASTTGRTVASYVAAAHTTTPSRSAAASAAPTPTPDPWAGHFQPEGAAVLIQNTGRSPWIYRTQTLSITVTIPQSGLFKNKYFKAEIYTRSQVPTSGFANKDPKGRSTAMPAKIARQYNAVLAITGDYISCTYNKKGVMIRNGVVYYDKKDAPTMAFLPGGEMKLYEPGTVTAKALLALGVKDSFAFGPILVKNGIIHPSVAKHKLNYHSYRAAIGQVEPGHYVLIATRSAILLTDLAQLFIDAGCQSAYNMDGGYSAAMVFMGKQINKDLSTQSQRSLPDILIMGRTTVTP